MDAPYIGMIAALPYSFAPLGWARCNGQLMPVSQNAALYSLIGNTFGGNATAFNLPDLRGRAIVGSTVMNPGPSGTLYPQGQTGGLEAVTLISTQMPQHTHMANITNATAPVTGSLSATVNVGNANGNAAATGNYLAGATANGDQIYSASKSATLNTEAVTVSPSGMNAALNNVPVQVGLTGGNLPHENRMPYLAIQYCIATTGIYPSRP